LRTAIRWHGQSLSSYLWTQDYAFNPFLTSAVSNVSIALS
jgi:hypothetical protein